MQMNISQKYKKKSDLESFKLIQVSYREHPRYNVQTIINSLVSFNKNLFLNDKRTV